MALIFSAPLNSTVAEFDAAQANEQSVDPRGLASPIAGYIEINRAPDGSTALMTRISASDAETYGGIRAEIDYVPEANAERWYVWDVWHEVGFNSADILTFMQIHDSPDGGESPVKYPNFEFMTQNGRVFCTVPIDCPDETSSNSRYPPQASVDLVTGRWVTCAVHSNWATDATGYIEAWYDGRILCREWGRACGYGDAVGPYWKLGLYDIAGTLTGSATAWYRNARLYSTGHSAFGVLGVNPKPAQLNQLFAA